MIIVQLDTEQLSNLIQSSVRKALNENPQQKGEPNPQTEQPLTIQQAADFLSLAVPTIYSKVSRGELPVMKRSKRLYFSRIDLINYLKQGQRETIAEIASEVGQYLINKKKRG